VLRCAKRVAALCLILILILSGAIAVIITEGALHPLLRRRSSDTAALAQSSASVVSGLAREVTVTAADGTVLKGWWLQPRHWTGRAVMACHGVADSGFGVMGDALLFLLNGYSVLVPDGRGHGASGGFVTYGLKESSDTLQWLAWMRAQGANKVFGFDESLGGAVLLQSLGAEAKFDALIAESPYASFVLVARERVQRYGHVPQWIAVVLVDEALLYARLAYHVSLWQVEPAEAVRNRDVPILLIHGKEDNETSPVHSEIIFRNAKCAELWLVPHAGHTGAYAAAPKAFEYRVVDWFNRH
jgi:dipeptidyl aminopeptidase/acylaminoacyl peptidase